jgi:hypothetical protein
VIVDAEAVIKLIQSELLPLWRADHEQVEVIDSWYRANQPQPWKPSVASTEYIELQRRSLTPWLSIPVTSVAQALYVEAYRAEDVNQNATPWSTWQANSMDARQTAVHRGALAHGVSYVTVTKGTLHGQPMPKVRGYSARKMLAFYQDAVEDEWPLYAIVVEQKRSTDPVKLKFLDGENVYHLTAGSSFDNVKLVGTPEPHGAGVCPVVRFANQLDLDGRSMGEVEPYISVAARIDQTTFDRLMTQKFSSWIIRTVTGLAKPETDDEAAAAKLKLQQDAILVADNPDVKFGSLPASPLGGFIDARDADIRDLAAVSQTPPHHLLGQMANLSAEALAAAESSLMRKVEERKHSFGESHEQWLRLAAHLMGDEAGATDFQAQVVWRDTESRSLAQAADALGKMATMLQVPVEILWEKIPGMTQQDIERAKVLIKDHDSVAMLTAELERQFADEPASAENAPVG